MSTMENLSQVLGRPTTERKYKKVKDEVISDGNNDDNLLRKGSKKPIHLASTVAEKMVKGTSKAFSVGNKKKQEHDRFEMLASAETTTTTAANLSDDCSSDDGSLSGFLERPPARRKYKKVDEPQEATDGSSQTTAKIISSPLVLARKKMAQAKKIVSGAPSDSTTKVDRVTATSATTSDDGSGSDEDSIASLRTVFSHPIQWSKRTVSRARDRLEHAVKRKKSNMKNSSITSSMRSSIVSDMFLSFNDCEMDEKGVLVIVMTPNMEYLLHDVTIALVILSLLALFPTYRNWKSIAKNQLPASIIFVWLLFTFFAGMEIGRYRGMRPVQATDDGRVEMGDNAAAAASLQRLSGSDNTSVLSTKSLQGSMLSIPTSIKLQQRSRPAPCKEGHALFLQLMQTFQKVKLVYSDAEVAGKDSVSITTESAATDATQKSWSTLTHRENREVWEQPGFVKVADPLMNRLLKHPDHTRKPLQQMIAAIAECTSAKIESHEPSTLEKDVVDPCFPLRGMDVFLTDAPETDMSSHPFLIQHGLRDKPTMVANIMLQWANILIYFELPDWFTDFDSIVENEDDANDVIAVKRFLSGDDEYRSQRMKILPCLVNGPLPIRVLAPSKKEISIQASTLPSKWIKHSTEITPDGRKLQPCLELELDIVSNSTLRSISSMSRRYLKTISLDLAVIVEHPETDPSEPSACLGLWRFQYIDLDRCPSLPVRNTECNTSELQQNVLRASQIVCLSPEDLATIQEECEEVKPEES